VQELKELLPKNAEYLTTRRFKAVKKFIADNPAQALRVA
jgi:hypothetical protein